MASKSERTSGLKTTATTPGAIRPRFRERQILRAADLEAEQSYLMASRRRHNIGQHGWGIVQGLEILNTPELVVQPGMAVDGYGRELIITTPVNIPTDVFTELGDDALDVWLVYQLVEMNVPQRGSWSCGPGKNTRTREQATLRLTPAPLTSDRIPVEVPRRPVDVPSADLPFPPHRRPPDDPSLEWPVYLGTIKQVPVFDDPPSPRPFATANGELVIAPSGVARMQVGAELQSDTRRFAVTLSDASGKQIERLGIDRDGNTLITGNTTVMKSVTDVNARLLHLRLGPARLLNFGPLAAPAAAAPWKIYRTSVKEDQRTIQQLRFEIAHPGEKGDPAISRLAIGTRDAAGAFSPCLTVSADCTLTIEGDLNIVGQLMEGPVLADASDPRFGALIAQHWGVGTKVGEVTATTGTIVGTVTDENGGAMRGVNVELTKTGVATINALTDEAGRYVGTLIPIGDYTISAQAPGFQRTTIQRTLAAAQTLDVPITLRRIPPSGTIRGNVMDSNGAILPAVTVRLTHVDTNVARDFTTNEVGLFNATPLPVGQYSIIVVGAPSFTPVVRTLTAGATIEVTLTIAAAIIDPG